MRDWHTKVIKLQEARNIIAVNNSGDPNLYVGVIEGKIEYSKIDANTSKYSNYNYKSPNNHLANSSGNKKVIYRQKVDGPLYDENLYPDTNEVNTMTHTTCVAGIIAGNEISNVYGICPNVNILNAVKSKDINGFEVALLLGLINEYSKGNIGSYYYDKYILKKNSVGGLLDGTGYLDKNKLPVQASSTSNGLSDKKCSIISCSFSLKGYNSNDNETIPKEIADFILTELFAYGRDGRGILTIFSAGNEEADIDNVDSGPVFSSKTLIVAASKVTLNVGNMNLNSEDKAKYSNYGKRVDLCAPSCPIGRSAIEDLEIYAPTAINCGEIGDDDQVLTATVLHKSNNGKELILNDRYNVIMVGQSIEIGEPINLSHEVRFITKVETEQYPSNPNPAANIRTKITLNEALLFTENTILSENVRICIYKKSVEKFSASQLKLDNLNGIGKYQSPLQTAYLYSENPANTNDFSVGMTVTIKNKNGEGNIIDIEEQINLTRLTDLKLIPGQITAKLKRASYGSGNFIPADNNSSLQGFFAGQQVYIKEESVKRHLKFIVGTGATTRTQFSQLSSEPGEDGTFTNNEYNIKSLAYGNITSSFGGTSAAAPIVSGVAALILSANSNLNAAEIKHILKVTARRITSASYNQAPSNNTQYNYGYDINEKFGTGRIDAEKAVKLAKNWHCSDNGVTTLPHPDVPVLKPRLEIADKLNGTTIENVPVDDPVDSPDIWVSELANSNTTPVAPFNMVDTSKKQYINIRVRNTGNRNSFKECNLRVFVAFTDVENPAFPFPSMWYDQTDVKLLAVKEIPIIAPNASNVIQIEWKDIAAKWTSTWNQRTDASAGGTGKRKRTYILAHISPFDGLDDVLSTTNIRNNKQLTCKELIVMHNGVSDGTSALPGNNFNMTVGSTAVPKAFDLSMENVLSTQVNTLKIKATKRRTNNNTTVEDTVFFSKSGAPVGSSTEPTWVIEGGDVGWISFTPPIQNTAIHNDHTDVKFPHTLTVSNQEDQVKIEIVTV
ncbi:MAG: S8 family serine peptidase [Flavobacterium sp.]